MKKLQNDLMVASDLQDALVAEITELLSETSSTNAQGEAVTGVTFGMMTIRRTCFSPTSS